MSAEKQLDWEKLLDEALTMPGKATGVYDRFYSYSYLNQVYLSEQGVAEPVATYKRWQAIGRQVLKGSKAKEIIRPIFAHHAKEDVDDEAAIIGFKAVKCIFTYSQTEGEELPPAQIPEWNLDTALQKLNITRIPFRKNDANIQGYAKDRSIAINPFAKYPAKTTLHEISHIALGHTMPETVAEYETHQGVFEFEAESTAYLCLNELGQIDEEQAAVSRAYVQGWMSGERPPDRSIRKVFNAVDKILKAGRLAIDLSPAPL